MERGKRVLMDGIIDDSMNLNEGLVTTYKGKRVTLEEYQELCKELNVNEISEIK